MTIDDTMNKYARILVILVMSFFHVVVNALGCPDPQTTSLRWGEVPKPWIESPFSATSPQADDAIHFQHAHILVAGYGQGVACTYRISTGDFTIWWQVRTKIPARTDYSWIETQGGFVCVQGIDACQFQVVSTSN